MVKNGLIALVMMIAGAGALAADGPIYTGIYDDHAVSGYDTVEFFKSGKPTKGKEAFKLDYMGAEWLFASQDNLDIFKANPQKYMPQYGGYCAWAMARGHTAASDPNYWSIQNGKLYLNYNAKVKTKWEKNKTHFIDQADKRYPETVDMEEGN